MREVGTPAPRRTVPVLARVIARKATCRPAAEVMNKQIARDGQGEPGSARSLGQVVVIEHPQAEPLVEAADRLVDGSLDQDAEARQLANGEPFPPMLVAPPPRKGRHLVQAAVGLALDQLRRRPAKVDIGPTSPMFSPHLARGKRARPSMANIYCTLAKGGQGVNPAARAPALCPATPQSAWDGLTKYPSYIGGIRQCCRADWSQPLP